MFLSQWITHFVSPCIHVRASYPPLNTSAPLNKTKIYEIENTAQRMKLAQTRFFFLLNNFHNFRGVCYLFCIMYLSLLLKMIDEFPDQQKSWLVPLSDMIIHLLMKSCFFL